MTSRQDIDLLNARREGEITSLTDLNAAGVAFAADGQLLRAEEYFRKAAALNSSDFYIAQNLSSTLIRLGKFSDAYESLSFVNNSSDVRPHQLLYFARFCYLLGAFEVATSTLQRLIAAQPQELKSYVLLADTLRQRGRGQDAELVLDEAARVSGSKTLPLIDQSLTKLQEEAGDCNFSQQKIDLYIEKITSAHHFEKDLIQEAGRLLIEAGLFHSVRELCTQTQSIAASRKNSTSLISDIMLSCIAAELAAITQLEYEIENYGHIDVRHMSGSQTTQTDFLWRSVKDLLTEAEAFQRLYMPGCPPEDQCFNICRLALLTGNLDQLTNAAAKFDTSLSPPSDRIRRVRAFAEYASGNTLVARQLLAKTRNKDFYVLGGYTTVDRAAVRKEAILAEFNSENPVKAVPVWNFGERFLMQRKFVSDHPTLNTIQDAVLLNDHGTLLFKNEIIRETINCDPGKYIYGWPNVVHSEREKALICVPPINIRIDYPVILASHSRDQTSFAHWILDVLPRILFAATHRDLISLPIVVTRELTDWQMEVLTLASVDLSRIVVIEDQFPILLSEVVLPVTTSGLYPMTQSIKFLRQHIEVSGKLSSEKPWRRLYVARRANFRSLLNDAEIAEYLVENGFETVVTNNMTVEQQMCLFSEAEIVLAVGGAAVTNLLFMQPGTRAIVIGPSTNYGDYFAHLAANLGISYAAAVGPPVPDLVNSYVGWNFTVALDDIKRALDDINL